MNASTQTKQRRDTVLDRHAALTTIQQQALFLTIVEELPIASVATKLDLEPDVAAGIVKAARTKLAVSR
jgi:hypothetical protein